MAKRLHRFGVISGLIATGVALAGLDLCSSERLARASEYTCLPTSRLVVWTIDRIQASPSAKKRQLSCEQIALLDSASPDALEVTTGRVSGKPVICLLVNRDQPCKYIVAELPLGVDPTAILSRLFAYENIPTMLNETVERLFIRPVKFIK